MVLQTDELMVDKELLEKMGLSSRALWLINYDLFSPSKRFTDQTNKMLKSLRNALNFQLKYHIRATRHLESTWIIPDERLATATKVINQLKLEFKERGYHTIDRRICIYPIFTTIEGMEYYEDKKVEFLLEFLTEAQQFVDRGLEKRQLAYDKIWQAKKTAEIVQIMSDSMKEHERYKELMDTLGSLEEGIFKFEDMRRKQKEAKKLAKKMGK